MVQYSSAMLALLSLLALQQIMLVTCSPILSSDSHTHHNQVIDDVLKTLRIKGNHTMERNKELFCKRRFFETDAAIGYEGCDSYIVQKAYCVGQCSSIYLPGQGSGALSCSMCEVTKRRVKSVKLHCQSGVRIVTIPIVEECGCRPCKVNNVIPEPPWRKLKLKVRGGKLVGKRNKKKKKKNRSRNNKSHKNKAERRRKLKLRQEKKRNRKKLRLKRRQMRLQLLRVHTEKQQRRRAKKNNNKVMTYDDLVKMMMFSWKS